MYFSDASLRWAVIPVRAHAAWGQSRFQINKNEDIRYISLGGSRELLGIVL